MREIAARLLYLLWGRADNAHMGAFITVSDAAGRVLLRRPATDVEVMSAIAAAEAAEAEGRAAMERIARERDSLAADGDDA